MEERIELRVRGGLLGILVGGTALVVKRGNRMYEVDLADTLFRGEAVIVERVLHPEGMVDKSVDGVDRVDGVE